VSEVLSVESADRMSRGERRILAALVQFSEWVQRSVLTAYKRSSRDTYIQRLSEKGYAVIRGPNVQATDAGRAAVLAECICQGCGKALPYDSPINKRFCNKSCRLKAYFRTEAGKQSRLRHEQTQKRKEFRKSLRQTTKNKEAQRRKDMGFSTSTISKRKNTRKG